MWLEPVTIQANIIDSVMFSKHKQAEVEIAQHLKTMFRVKLKWSLRVLILWLIQGQDARECSIAETSVKTFWKIITLGPKAVLF